jgi:hypothetical protein
MTRSRELKKIILPLKVLEAMPLERRSALLMLGLLLNEANWLRKLLITAVLGTSDSPEGQASYSLTLLMATTLVGKVHEGWTRLEKGWLHDALDVPDTMKPLRDKLAVLLSAKTFVRIRNNIGFHYPEKPLDFKKLSQHIDDSDAIIFMAPEGFEGDLLSHISTLVGIEPLLATNSDPDYQTVLTSVWDEVTNATGLYCNFVSGLIATLISQSVPGFTVEDITLPDAPEANQTPIRFFIHPPGDLTEMCARVEGLTEDEP